MVIFSTLADCSTDRYLLIASIRIVTSHLVCGPCVEYKRSVVWCWLPVGEYLFGSIPSCRWLVRFRRWWRTRVGGDGTPAVLRVQRQEPRWEDGQRGNSGLDSSVRLRPRWSWSQTPSARVRRWPGPPSLCCRSSHSPVYLFTCLKPVFSVLLRMEDSPNRKSSTNTTCLWEVRWQTSVRLYYDTTSSRRKTVFTLKSNLFCSPTEPFPRPLCVLYLGF